MSRAARGLGKLNGEAVRRREVGGPSGALGEISQNYKKSIAKQTDRIQHARLPSELREIGRSIAAAIARTANVTWFNFVCVPALLNVGMVR